MEIDGGVDKKWKLTLLRFFHGILIPTFNVRYGLMDSKEDREEVKKIFKKYFHVDSLGKLTSIELRVLINKIIAVSATIWGVELPEIGNPPEDNEDTTLQEFFKMIYEQ